MLGSDGGRPLLPHNSNRSGCSSPSRKRRAILVPRAAVWRGVLASAACGTLVLVLLFVAGWEVSLSRRQTARMHEQALLAAHANSVRLVRQALLLQTVLDSQEDHERKLLHLYLELERERLPALKLNLDASAAHCTPAAREALGSSLNAFMSEAQAHSEQMLDLIQREGSRHRRAAQELAVEVAALARADRERMRGETNRALWSAADLQGPLEALEAELNRPNATVELPLQQLQEWEGLYAKMEKEGSMQASTREAIRIAVARSPLAHDHPSRTAVLNAHNLAQEFLLLLQRVRLHRHAPELRQVLRRWRADGTAIWDVVELIERLRLQHVFPMAMLKLHDHEWSHMVSDASDSDKPPQFTTFDAHH